MNAEVENEGLAKNPKWIRLTGSYCGEPVEFFIGVREIFPDDPVKPFDFEIRGIPIFQPLGPRELDQLMNPDGYAEREKASDERVRRYIEDRAKERAAITLKPLNVEIENEVGESALDYAQQKIQKQDALRPSCRSTEIESLIQQMKALENTRLQGTPEELLQHLDILRRTCRIVLENSLEKTCGEILRAIVVPSAEKMALRLEPLLRDWIAASEGNSQPPVAEV